MTQKSESISNCKKIKSEIRSKKENHKEKYFDEKGNSREDIRNSLNQTMKQEGTILEFKALSTAKKKGYTVGEYFYRDSNEAKNRQLDLRATKRIKFKLFDTEIIFEVHILGECKYKSEMDILFFDDGFKWEYCLNLPIPVNSDLVPGMNRFENQSFVPVVSSKITQLNPNLLKKPKNKKKNHLVDSQIYDASKQLYSALKVYHRELKNELNSDSQRILDRRSYIYLEYMRSESRNMKFSEFLSKEKKSCSDNKEYLKRILSGIDYLKFKCIIPVIILGENSMVLKAEFDKHFELSNLVDIGVGVLKHDTDFKLYDDYDDCENYTFITNVRSFELLLDNVETYLNNVKKYIKNTTQMYPGTILCDLKDAMSEDV